MQELISPATLKLIDYGVLGIIVFILGLYIYFTQKGHRVERKEWKDQSNNQFNTLVTVTSENTKAVSGLKATMDTFITYNKGKE